MRKTTRVKSLIPIAVILALASAYGIWYQSSRGKFREVKVTPKGALSADILGQALGSRATLVQFSSAFCTPCRATKLLLQNVIVNMPDVRHIDIDAEGHLDLVRELDIRSTPTTLFLDSAGLEVGRAVGAPHRDQVLNALASLH